MIPREGSASAGPFWVLEYKRVDRLARGYKLGYTRVRGIG